MKFFKLKFHSALHVDSKGSGEPESIDEFIRSDTLSAALMISWNTLYPEDGENIFQNPPIKISSAFPFVGDVLLFPVPLWNFWSDLGVESKKEAKKVKWISRGILEKLLQGGIFSFKSVDVLKCGIAVSKQEVDTVPIARDAKAWEVEERQRVSVDRIGGKDGGATFFFAMQFFSSSSGLYFLADGEKQELKKLETVLHFLGDSGIGADRNSGLGHFKIQDCGDIKFNGLEGATGSYTLSLLNPGEKDTISELLENSAYDLETRSGWIFGTTLGRPPLRVFSEGSFFSGQPMGRVVDMLDTVTKEKYNIQLEHSASRDYRAFTLPCKTPSCLMEKS